VHTTVQPAPSNEQFQLPSFVGEAICLDALFGSAVDTAIPDAPLPICNEVDGDKFVAEYTKAVHGIAARVLRVSRLGKICAATVQEDDLFQVGIMAGLDAARRWDPSKKKTLANWVYYKAEKAMLDNLRKEVPHAISQRYSTECEAVQDPVDLEMLASVSQVVSRLTPRQKQFVQLFYVEDRNGEECGLIMGVTREAVRQLKERTLRDLRGMMGVK